MDSPKPYNISVLEIAQSVGFEPTLNFHSDGFGDRCLAIRPALCLYQHVKYHSNVFEF